MSNIYKPGTGGGGGGVSSVVGTPNRITSTGGANPQIDIAANYVGQTSLTTLGTITTGTWNGTTIGATFGGTGQSTYTTGDTLYASATNTLSKLPIGTTGQVLTVAGGIPTWATQNSVQNIVSSTINFKNTGVTGIFTPASNFLVTAVIIYNTAITGSQSGYVFNVGFTPTSFDDYVSGGSSQGNPTGWYTGFFDGADSSAPVTPSGQTISIDVTSAETTATVSQGEVIIQGIYV